MSVQKVIVFFITFSVYAGLHSLRQGWSYSKNQLINAFSLDKSTFGIIDTCYLFAYSLGMATIANLSKSTRLNRFIGLGMIAATICYVSFALIYQAFNFFNIVLVGAAMVINGFFQSTGWPGIMAVFGNWFGQGNRGLIMGIWAINANIGNIVGLVVCNTLQHTFNVSWTYNFFVTAIFTLLIAFMTLLFLQEKPSLPLHEPIPSQPYENQETLKESILTDDKNQNQNHNSISVFAALFLPRVPYYVVGYSCLKGCIYGLLFWLPTYLQDRALGNEKGYISAMVDIGSFIGGLIVGHLGDRYKLRALFLSPLLFVSSVIMFLVSFALTDVAWTYYCAMFFIGITIGGPYNIIGSAITIDLGQQTGGQNVSSVSALIEGSAAVFAALSQIVISILPFEWIFYLFCGECILAAISLLPLFINDWRSLTSNKTEQRQKLY